MKTVKRMPKPRLTTARGAATRARIVAAAAQLVCARGVGGTSLDDVMEASATSKSQLYHYFANRDALIRAVIETQTGRVIGFQASCLQQVDSLAGLRRWRDAVVDISRANGAVGGCPIGSLASELADRSENARELLTESFRMWESHLVRGLQAMRDRGEIEPDANPADLATAVIGALQGGLLLAKTMRTTRPLELALDMALDHIVRRSAGSSTSACE